MTVLMRAARRLISVAVLALAALPAAAFTPDRLAEALESVARGDWARAGDQARAAGTPVAADIVEWHRLRAGQGDWSDHMAFLRRNPDWPGLDLMRRRAEDAMPGNLPADQLRAFFADGLPQTGRGVLLHADTLPAEAAKVERARAWRTMVMNREDRAAFLDRFGSELRPLHAARLDMLLWEGQTDAAEELLPLVPAADAALARARIALQRETPGVDALIGAVPASHANDGGLAHDRFRWRLDKGRWDSAEELLRERSTGAEALGRPEAWSSSRRAIARNAMREGRIADAYRLASQHFLRDGSDYADLEWLAGYLALTGLGDPARALTHFERFAEGLETPISLGRAGYWIGRAHEAAGNRDAARAAYAIGGVHQTSFYGQLAAERIGMAVDDLPARWGGLPDWRGRAFADASPIAAAMALQAVGDSQLALRFILHVQESLGPEDSAALARMGVDIGLNVAAVKIGKRLVRDAVIYPEAYYPVTSLARWSEKVPPELAMSVARQETELNERAISHAGARGLMQLMPGTAKKVAGDLGLRYEQVRLIDDPAYNALLGTAYLAEMLERFDGSVLLAAAAYNAGPHRVDRWIAQYGDPRAAGADPIWWIENIPFRETRNYVMRVLESQHVYRTRITRQAGPIGLTESLREGG